MKRWNRLWMALLCLCLLLAAAGCEAPEEPAPDPAVGDRSCVYAERGGVYQTAADLGLTHRLVLQADGSAVFTVDGVEMTGRWERTPEEGYRLFCYSKTYAFRPEDGGLLTLDFGRSRLTFAPEGADWTLPESAAEPTPEVYPELEEFPDPPPEPEPTPSPAPLIPPQEVSSEPALPPAGTVPAPEI